jgi:signal transduction histidine kinase
MSDHGNDMNTIEPHDVTQEGSEIAALRLENENLSRQVKRLVKAEGKLYEFQEQLDVQLKEYQELYELNRKLIAASELRTIFEYATEYIINKLGYERVIFSQQSEHSGDYAISAIDGYYDHQEKSAVAKLVISPEAPILSPLLGGREYLVCTEDTEQHELAAYRAKMLMNEYMLFRLGSHARPLALLAIGNTVEKAEFCRRVSDNEGALLGIGNLVGLLSPTIERKRDEHEIRRLNTELEQKIVQLQNAQEELVRKEKLSILGQLSGSVGHELRNPLGVMSNAVYFLKMVLSDADEITKEYLDILKHEIDNSQRIITDLLDFARTRPPQTKAVTARELTDESLGRCVIPDNIDLQTEIPANLPLLRVDPLQMGQVLTNFITNSVQAMPDGGKLRVAARRILNSELGVMSSNSKSKIQKSKSDGDFVEISVTDTGEGIAPENMKKLFQPLFTTKAKGIGLGLVVCRNLVEANGGRIAVESELGKGTTFTVILPGQTERVSL